MHFLAIVQMLSGRNFRVFWIVDSVAVFSIFLSVVYLARYVRIHAGKLAKPDFLVLLYLGWSLFSVFFYLQKNNPASWTAFLYGIHYLVFPIFLYFSVKRLDWSFQEPLLKNICYLNVFLFLVGLLMFYWQPAFYTEFLRTNIMSQYPGLAEWQLYGRLQSYLGSTTIGLLSGVTAVLLNIFKIPALKKIAMISACLFAGVLTQQRGGFVAVAVGGLYFILTKKQKILMKVVSAMAAVLLLILALNFFHNRTAAIGDRLDLTNYIKLRLVRDTIGGNPFQERISGYRNGLNNVVRFPMGLGLGATTSAADAAQANPGGQVVDANYMRIMSDLGLPGLALFLLINGAVLRSLRKKPNRFAFMAALAIYAVVALGTNVFDHYYMGHFYWLLLGIMTSRQVVAAA